jgi:hypothetical protein
VLAVRGGADPMEVGFMVADSTEADSTVVGFREAGSTVVGFREADSTGAGSMVVDFREVGSTEVGSTEVDSTGAGSMVVDFREVGSTVVDSTGTVGFIGMTVFAATSEYSSVLRSSGIHFSTLMIITLTLTLPRFTLSGNHPQSTFRGNRITGTTVPTRVATILTSRRARRAGSGLSRAPLNSEQIRRPTLAPARRRKVFGFVIWRWQIVRRRRNEHRFALHQSVSDGRGLWVMLRLCPHAR